MQTIIEVENTMLTNQPRYRREPEVRPWRYYLFCWKVRTFKTRPMRRSRFLYTLTAKTRRGVDSLLRKFIARKDVVLITSNGRRIRKAWGGGE